MVFLRCFSLLLGLLKITYFSDIDDAQISPFPEAYTNIAVDKAYLITGSFVHRPRSGILVL